MLINFPSPSDWPGISNAALNFLGQLFRACLAIYESGATAQRPVTGLWIGRPYFDTTLGKPIWYKSPGWVKADGTAA